MSHLRKLHSLLILSLWCVIPANTNAEPFTGTGTLGHYTGSFSYSSTSATEATITFSILNTSPALNGGFLTAIVFNNPDDLITGVSLSSAPTNFQLLGAAGFSNGINASPYGQFDIGASTSSSFQGGGAPSNGLGVGVSGSFEFQLTGTLLDTLAKSDFYTERSVPPGIGEGRQFFAARFRGFLDEGSDKVPATLDNPEPSTLTLAGIGAIVLIGGYRRKNKVNRKASCKH